MSTHVLDLTHGAVETLKLALGSPGWYDTASLAYRAGQILEMPELDITAPPVPEAVDGWRKHPMTLTLSEKLRDTAKKCVEHYLKKGGFAITKDAMVLMRELGLAPED